MIPALFLCTVATITDGDSLRCADNTRVRLSGIAAREHDNRCLRGHPCPDASGAEATAALARLVEGQVLRCEATGTTFGRIAAFCEVPGRGDVSCLLLRSGVVAYWPRYDPHNRLRNCR